VCPVIGRLEQEKSPTAKMNGKRERNAVLPYIQEYANIGSHFGPVTGNLKSNTVNIRKC
jgi:hypothetical protein